MLTLEGISKSYGNTKAVREISFQTPEGEIFGLLGANGAGKTTTVRMVLDIIRPDEGEIAWHGTPVTSLPRRLFGYLPEERGLYPDMKVADQLLFFARIQGLSKSEAGKNIAFWLERFDISHYGGTLLRELSKGNQQKVQFLAAVLHAPEVLVLDEPFSGLDPVNNELLKEVILELKENGTTLLLSTHDMERAEELCESVALIHHSQLAFAGPLWKLRGRHARRRTLRLDYDGGAPALLERFPELEIVQERPE